MDTLYILVNMLENILSVFDFNNNFMVITLNLKYTVFN